MTAHSHTEAVGNEPQGAIPNLWNGFVVLTVDAAGSGERAECEREWSYHGAFKAAELFLGGDSLMGEQIRDNRRAVDALQSLPFEYVEDIQISVK